MDFLIGIFKDIIGWIWNNIRGKGIGAWILKAIFIISAFLGLIIMFFYKEDFFQKNFQKPHFSFKEENGMDIIRSDIKLGEGSVVVTPLLAVKYNDEIIQTVKLSKYYNDNQVMFSSYEEESVFELEVDDQQRKKLNDIPDIINSMLNEKIESESFEVDIVYLTVIKYQNEKSNTSHEDIYWYFSKEESREISRVEAELWGTKHVIDLDKYEIEGFKYNNSQLLHAVNSCIELVNE